MFGVGEGGAELGECKGEQPIWVGDVAPGAFEGFVCFEELGLIEFCDAGLERGRCCELLGVAGVAACGEVSEPASIERLALAFGVLLRWWRVGHEALA